MTANGSIIDLTLSDSYYDVISQRPATSDSAKPRNPTAVRRKRPMPKPRSKQPRNDSIILIPDETVTVETKLKKSKRIREKLPEEPQEKKAKVLGCCPICFDDFGSKPLSATKCGHVFCTHCIKLALKDAACCPQCRTKLRGATAVHPLYLPGI